MLGFRRLNWREEFPFTVPAIASIEQLSLNAPVTLLAGDNGSGKSTILEAMAAAAGFPKQGGELDRLGELPAVPGDVLDEHKVPLLAPVLSATRPRSGYFLRAESFFNVAEFIDSGDRFAPDLVDLRRRSAACPVPWRVVPRARRQPIRRRRAVPAR